MLTMRVSPDTILVVVTITVNHDTVCAGTQVQFHAIVSIFDTNTVYKWKVMVLTVE